MQTEYTKEELLNILKQYEEKYNRLPLRKELREFVSDKPFCRAFGSFSKAKKIYEQNKYKPIECKYETTLPIPDAHVDPNQDLSRFDCLNKFIKDRRPDNIIFMGDFITLESLSNWDLNKSGVMEGRRYQLDIQAGKDALKKTLEGFQEENYYPRIIFLKGNHCFRLDRYIDTKPELKEHLNIERDLCLREFGIDEIVEYKESCEICGTIFTHAPMNAANQAVSGKYAIHRAAEMTHKSLVFAHTHRMESVNFYRHGANTITQVLTCGCFFEHTDSYAYGGLNAYFRGLCLLTHWKEGRFDVEDIALERLKEIY